MARVLLINPKDTDIVRASQIVRLYRHQHAGEVSRSRHSSVIYTSQGYENACEVWHTPNQITIHFGNEE